MNKYLLILGLTFSMVCQQALAEDSFTNRNNSSFGIDIGYAPISLPLPGTMAATVYYIVNPNWQVGFEYAWTSLGIKAFSFEVGSIEENNRTLKARYFPGNSFNWIMGYGRRDLKVKLAANLFDLATHEYSNTVTRTRTEYAQLGFGNQWQWKKGYALTIDWLTLNIPFAAEVTTSADRYANSEKDAERIRDLEKTLAWYPQAWIVEFKVGFAF